MNSNQLQHLQVKDLPGLDRTLDRLGTIEIQWKLRHLAFQVLWGRIRIDTAPRYILDWFFHFQLEFPSFLQIPPIQKECKKSPQSNETTTNHNAETDLNVRVLRRGVIFNIHTMNIRRRKEQEMLLAGDNGVEILVVILVERSLREVIPNPQVHDLRQGTQGFARPRDMLIAIASQGTVLRPEAIVLLLRVRYETALSAAPRDHVQRLGERHALRVRRGEAERRRRRGRGGGVVDRNERIGAPVGGEVDGDGGGSEGASEVRAVAPEGGGRPVSGGGSGDEAGLVGRDEVAKELERRRGRVEAADGGGVAEAQVSNLLPQRLDLLHR